MPAVFPVLSGNFVRGLPCSGASYRSLAATLLTGVLSKGRLQVDVVRIGTLSELARKLHALELWKLGSTVHTVGHVSDAW